jgi:hypothetical protein
VQKDIDEGKVVPGQYLILYFDFSGVIPPSNLTKANVQLIKLINNSLMDFYRTYADYLGEDFTDLCRTIDSDTPSISLLSFSGHVRSAIMQNPRLAGVQGVYLIVDEYDAFPNAYLEHTLGASKTEWAKTEVAQTLKSFWSTAKLLSRQSLIKKTFITGISPLSLSNAGSAFNITRNVSFHKHLAGLCGLTSLDLESALRMINKDDKFCNDHLANMRELFNGYHFSQETVESMFNTETCLAYLQALVEGVQPDTTNPQNSEISEDFLTICASSASVTMDFQRALDGPLEYDQFKAQLTLGDLVC